MIRHGDTVIIPAPRVVGRFRCGGCRTLLPEGATGHNLEACRNLAADRDMKERADNG
jgi:hypothetical protein